MIAATNDSLNVHKPIRFVCQMLIGMEKGNQLFSFSSRSKFLLLPPRRQSGKLTQAHTHLQHRTEVRFFVTLLHYSSLFSILLALQHGDGCCGSCIGIRLRGPRLAPQPFPALRLLSDAAGAAGHPGQQHAGSHQRRQQQWQHQQLGVFEQFAGPRQRPREGQGPRTGPGPGQPRHLGIVEVLGGSCGGGRYLWLHVGRYLSRLDPQKNRDMGDLENSSL